MKPSPGGVTPVFVLTLICVFLFTLIIGQGIYLFRLEQLVDRSQKELAEMKQCVKISKDLLTLEFHIPFELSEWEQIQSHPDSVPDGLRSTYHSWNTARYAAVERALSAISRLQESGLSDPAVSQTVNELESLLKSLKSRHSRRLREDVRHVLEGEG